MKKRFIYHDEKSNKFWWIDYEGDSLAVNYGKVGSIGKFQTKEFDNEEQCLKEASKLIAAKMKKIQSLTSWIATILMMKKLGYMLKRHTQTSSAILLIHFICVAGMKNLLLAAMKVLML